MLSSLSDFAPSFGTLAVEHSRGIFLPAVSWNPRCRKCLQTIFFIEWGYELRTGIHMVESRLIVKWSVIQAMA